MSDPKPEARNLAQDAAAASDYLIRWMADMGVEDRNVQMAALLNTCQYILLDFGRNNERHSRQRRTLYQAAITCANLRDAALKSAQRDYDGKILDWGLGDLERGGESAIERQGREEFQKEPGEVLGIPLDQPDESDYPKPVPGAAS
jgi:hypothetical protein